MYERPSGSWITGPINSLVLKHTVKHEIHVLLVDHDIESLISIAKMLELCSYKVTTTKLASNAMEMLSNGWKFDLIMANINSPDMLAPRLLHEAVRREILVVLIAEIEDALVAERALQYGALHFLKKPPPMDVLKYLWQHVERERMERNKKKGKPAKKANKHGNLAKEKVEIPDVKGSSEVDIEKNDNGKSKASGKSKSEESESIAAEGSDVKVKGKVCVKWTSDLHAKFVDAVNQLGDGKCYPLDILEVMKVPGLTRLQIASHLQKCRKGMWREPEEPKKVHSPPPIADDFPKYKSPKRAYGSMLHPNICDDSSSQPMNQGYFKSTFGIGDKTTTEYLFF